MKKQYLKDMEDEVVISLKFKGFCFEIICSATY